MHPYSSILLYASMPRQVGLSMKEEKKILLELIKYRGDALVIKIPKLIENSWEHKKCQTIY